ncbi:MAG: hypothetical protein ACYTX0_46555, partial [Nostoc sp.]
SSGNRTGKPITRTRNSSTQRQGEALKKGGCCQHPLTTFVKSHFWGCVLITQQLCHIAPISKSFMDDLNSHIQDAKTDEVELKQVLKKYDLDEELAFEFSEIDKAFRQLEIKYQSLLNTRKFFNDGKN